MVLRQLDIHTQNKFQEDSRLKYKRQIFKLLKENIRENLYDFGVGEGFLNHDTHKYHKEKD